MAQKNKGGRPTKFKEDYIRQAYVACNTSGMTDLQLADLFGVAESTIYKWKEDHPKFSEAIKNGKDEFDCKTAEESLKKLIEGYDYQEAKVITDGDGNVIRKEMTKKHVSPNPGSLCFFLKNRNPTRWRDMKAIELSGDPSNPIQHNHTVTPEDALKERGIPVPGVELEDVE